VKASGERGTRNNYPIITHSYLGIHEITALGNALTNAFNGKAPRYSYSKGGPKGGRRGLIEA
jgi:hypothetical protein